MPDQVIPLLVFPLILFALTTLIAGYLSWFSLTGDMVAGCGPTSGCNQVLSSRWSSLMGIPVSLLAIPVYVGLIIGIIKLSFPKVIKTVRQPWNYIISLSFIVAGAGIWFLFVQLVLIESICYFCMASHLLGLLGALMVLLQFRRIQHSAATAALKKPFNPMVKTTTKSLFTLGLWGLAGTFALILGQLLYQPDTHKTIELSSNKAQSFYTDKKWIITLHNEKFALDLNELPIIGLPSADQVIVILFDYTCKSCRFMHDQLLKVQATFKTKLAILLLPVPLDATCNQWMQRANIKTLSDHENACQYARIGLAVWLVNRKSYQKFDNWIFKTKEPPPIDMARSYAKSLIGEKKLDKALADTWVNETLQLAGAIHEANYNKHGTLKMPQLMIGNLFVAGQTNDINILYQLLEKRFGLKR